jgi:hypothetical protein
MKRLVEQPGPHAPLFEEAVRLLRAAEGAHRARPGSKGRVRIALVRRPRPRSTPWLRASIAVFAAVGFVSALASGATVVRHWTRPADDVPPPFVAAASPFAGRAVVRHVILAADRAVSPPPVVPAPADPGFDRIPTPRLHAPARETAPAAAAAEQTAQLVLDGMAALRRDHDARRAQSLLDEYLRRSPDGPLAEEALALSIEAATAAHDEGARSRAFRYLAAYPHGRFRDAAERAASRPVP